MKRAFKDASANETNNKWYDQFPKSEAPCKHSKSDGDVIELKAEAKRYLEAETSAFQLRQSKTRNSETAWLKTMTTRGTTSDKVAASIVLIQDNPKYNISRLASVISQVRAAKHNQCTMVIAALRDLFLSDLLHPKYKLLKFEEQDLDSIGEANNLNTQNQGGLSRNKLLACWSFEDQLQEQYERFILSLAAIASDTVETNREKCISVMTDLLIGNAEQEHKLLELIVNKIGDPHSKVASKAVFCLNKLLYEHPNMKTIVLREVEKLLFRKNVAQRAQYYAICLLTQFILNREDEEIAVTLIDVYFAFFKACLKKGEPDSRMMAAILTGVNRAYRFAKMDSSKLQDHIDSVYKVVHIGSFNVSLNALNLLYQVTGKDEAQLNRFHSAFYRKLLDPQIGTANKRAMFLNLLFRVLKNDHSVLRSFAVIKRILQVTLYFPPNMTCAVLYVVSKVLKARTDLRRILPSTKIHVKTEFTCKDDDTLIKSEVESTDEEEHKAEVEENPVILSNVTTEPIANAAKTDDGEKEEIPLIKIEDDNEKSYDPFCRNPLYANASKSLTSELVALSKHFHPSVSLFANLIIEGKIIDYTGDPLEDLTLIRFLDRYVFKNPKKMEDKKVAKKNDPLAQRAGYTPKGIRNIAVGSAAYLNETEARIPVDELFLYRYLKRKNDSKNSRKSMDDDNESVNSEEFNDMLDELGGAEDDIEDLDIAADIQSAKGKKGARGNDNEEDDDEEDDENLEGSEDESLDDENESIDDPKEYEMGDVDDEGGDFDDLSDIDLEGIDDEELSEMEFNDDSDDDVEENGNDAQKKRGKKVAGGKLSKKSRIDENIFVSAEKFAEMLEEHSRAKGKHGGSHAFNTTDGASVKQLDWETKRDQRLRGTFDRRKRQAPKKFQKKYIKKAKR